MEIGHKIKQLRIQNDLTLEELASRSEVTKGFLSQLERDLTSPNISTLEDILEALGTNLSEFFVAEPNEQIVFGTDDYFVDENEMTTIEWIVPNAQKNEMEPIRLTIHPQCQSKEIKSHTGQEFGYVLKGSIELVIGQHIYKLRAQETFYISGKESHYIRNVSKRDATLIWVTTPPVF